MEVKTDQLIEATANYLSKRKLFSEAAKDLEPAYLVKYSHKKYPGKTFTSKNSEGITNVFSKEGAQRHIERHKETNDKLGVHSMEAVPYHEHLNIPEPVSIRDALQAQTIKTPSQSARETRNSGP